MSLTDEVQAGAPLPRKAGRPRKDASPVAVVSPPRPRGYDPDKKFRVTLIETEGGHRGPVPLQVVGDRGTIKATLIPGRAVVIPQVLLRESLKHAEVDERGPEIGRASCRERV